jgi:formate hydrogenlyase transcriptional activator
VLKQVEIAAPSDATVLVLGETGTGKELIARALHRLSSRSNGNFIKLNCAAIPTGLLESELFGHEKGAFTGAVSQKIGRLELADKGTIFLDEIGEIPGELQPKLLRVLQDHEFERLGGIRTIHVDVRLIAATNRDLQQAVAEHQFRSDLFYRLNVFPIHMPPLRERIGDIPPLVHYFVQKFARRMNKTIESIPTEIIRELERWNWPGNIRELENFIERSVILTQGPVFFAPMAELHLSSPERRSGTTLQDIEREYILMTLRETSGVIAGVHGAAVRLGMKRTTLQSRMHKLGINREDYGT